MSGERIGIDGQKGIHPLAHILIQKRLRHQSYHLMAFVAPSECATYVQTVENCATGDDG
ncbi:MULTISPECIES: hypothetical protein [Bradyrhizobium]|uniref:hypothetical protein n=1 Tax=Bradyrhizobium TaxID=374 RepID=UPI0027155935|nr:hypothetical protein [Bradyrhizobium elkanii]WLA46705.1 hypothetical protein QIH80_33935 [Bradyrhizobium elkanii]WLB83009.1 hypothetical protein QIH83_10795 [Bradyrhizobium elkanii]